MISPVALAVAASLATSPAVPLRLLSDATTSQLPPDAPHALRHDWALDGAVAGTAAVLWIGSEFFFKHSLAPRECRLLCERDPDGLSTVNSWDLQARAVRWAPENRRTAALISDALVYLILPATVGGLQYYSAAGSAPPGGVWVDYLLIAQAAAMAQVVNQTVKFLVGRERPYANEQTLADRLANAGDDDWLSFYSGHATFALSLTVAAGTVAQLRGYKHAWLLWSVAVPLALSVPYFRMAADKHYLSDVVIGSVLGAAFGVVVPLLHGRASPAAPPEQGAVSFAASPGGIMISGTF